MTGAFSVTSHEKSWIASIRIDGEWLLCDDGVRRPIIRGEILTGYGSWEPTEFLIDTGADRTVFTASLLAVLRLQATVSQHRLGGVGGLADAVVVERWR
jgi:hypothetical protein